MLVAEEKISPLSVINQTDSMTATHEFLNALSGYK